MKLIYILLILFIFKGIFWSLLIPIWQAPDEPNHFANVQFTGETGKPYVGRRDQNLSAEIAKSAQFLNFPLNLNLSEGVAPSWKPDFSQNFTGKFEDEIRNIPKESKFNFIAVVGGVKAPPLYYLTAGLFYRIFTPVSLIERVFLLRFLSVVLGTGVVWLSYLLAKELLASEKVSLVVATIISFHPTFNVLSSTINPDIMLIFLTSAFLYSGVKILKKSDFNHKDLLFFFVSLIASILTRFISLSLFIPSVIVLIPRKIYLIWLLLILGFAAVLVFFRSPGLLGEFGQFFTNFSPVSFINFASYSFTHYNSEVFSWYWAVFGWLETALPLNSYRVLRVLTVVSFAGLIWLVINWLKEKRFDRNSLVWAFVAITIFATVGIFVLFDWQTFARTGIGFGVQGRHFLTAISAQMIFFTVGIVTILKRFRIQERYSLFFLSFWFIFLNLLSIWVMINFFYQSKDIGTLILRASQYKPDFSKGPLFVFWASSFLTFLLIFSIKFFLEFKKADER